MKFYNFFKKLFLTSAHQNDLKTWFFFYFKQKKHSKFLGMWFAVPKHTFSVCWSRHDFFFLVMWLLRSARVGQREWLTEWRCSVWLEMGNGCEDQLQVLLLLKSPFAFLIAREIIERGWNRGRNCCCYLNFF
jgi:hypothetical protein